MKPTSDGRSSCAANSRPTLTLSLLLVHAFSTGLLLAQVDKPAGDKADWQKHLDEMARRTEQNQAGAQPRPVGGSPVSAPAAAGSGLQRSGLFEADFDRASVVSYTQHRLVLLVFAPQVEIDAWRRDAGLQAWAQRAVICPVHEGSLGARAGRLASAFGIDTLKGGVVAALVRAPDGVRQVAGDQLLYQVLGRYAAPHDAFDVLKILQQAAPAYDAKKNQYAWDATVTGAEGTSPLSTPVAAAPTATPTAPVMPVPPAPAASSTARDTLPAAPSSPTMPPVAASPTPEASQAPAREAKPAPPARSPFETLVSKAWQTQRPLMLIFPGKDPFDAAKCASAWKVMPQAVAPELLVLTPGSPDGNVGGSPVDWEAFFDVNGQYPTAVMVMPEADETLGAPKVSDMSFRVIARRQGALTPESAPVLARLWMSEDFDSVVMRSWVLRRPLLVVFPHPEHERDLLESPVLAKIEERLPVAVITKDSISGIRRRAAADLEKEYATDAVERAEIVLLRLESKVKDAASVRLDQIQLTPINRAFAKKSPDKVLDWVASRVPPKPARAEAGQ